MSEITNSRCVLKALTLQAKRALGDSVLVLDAFPFRVGRESRSPDHSSVSREIQEMRKGIAPRTNDLYIRDAGDTIFVSREHFQIEKSAPNQFHLVDRKSTLGTWVDGKLVGGDHAGGEYALGSGDVIFVGSYQSGFIFKFLTS